MVNAHLRKSARMFGAPLAGNFDLVIGHDLPFFL
jgi:hypothetical protein